MLPQRFAYVLAASRVANNVDKLLHVLWKVQRASHYALPERGTRGRRNALGIWQTEIENYLKIAKLNAHRDAARKREGEKERQRERE